MERSGRIIKCVGEGSPSFARYNKEGCRRNSPMIRNRHLLFIVGIFINLSLFSCAPTIKFVSLTKAESWEVNSLKLEPFFQKEKGDLIYELKFYSDRDLVKFEKGLFGIYLNHFFRICSYEKEIRHSYNTYVEFISTVNNIILRIRDCEAANPSNTYNVYFYIKDYVSNYDLTNSNEDLCFQISGGFTFWSNTIKIPKEAVADAIRAGGST